MEVVASPAVPVTCVASERFGTRLLLQLLNDPRFCFFFSMCSLHFFLVVVLFINVGMWSVVQSQRVAWNFLR